MRPSRITLLAPGGRCPAWLERVLECWPGGVPPEVRVLPPDDWTGRPDAGDPGVLALCCGAENRALVERVLEWADRVAAPALVLRAEGCVTPSHVPPGALVLPAASPPALLAGVLAGMCVNRRAALDALDELESMRAAQRSARQELDRLHEELHLASRVQAEFMPKALPAMPGLDLSVLFRPCGYVSGDVYDVRVLDEHRLGVFLADAMGHGVPAALMTLALCRLLPVRETTPIGSRVLEPAEAMERLNRALAESGSTSANFATAAYAVIDLRRFRVAVCGAGHPPPLVFGPGGRLALETQGPVLGVFDDATFDQVEFDLAPGQTLVLHTDGLEQAFPDSETSLGRPTSLYLAHLDALAAAGRAAGWSMQDFTARLSALLDEQAGSLCQRDDVTALAIAPRALAASDAA